MASTDKADVKRLRALKHIVVVMMENRSFDHMLGYLSMEGMTEVDGLTGKEFNFDPNGKKIGVTPFDATDEKLQRRGEALQKKLDPDHSVAAVRTQLGPGYPKTPHGPNGGFVKSFVESRNPKDKVTSSQWVVPMGYYTSKDVPVYDHLARQYCVCDRWFASVPGDTWPNRLYSAAGQEGPNVAKSSDLWQTITELPPLKQFRSLPLFDEPAFTRRLGDGQWRWYSHDPGTLRLIDMRYRRLDNPMRNNFAFFDRRKVGFLTEAAEAAIVRGNSFLDDAAENKLPQVSWIDPNFVDVSVLETQSNDDHPPSDIRSGQAFIFEVYNALMHSKEWKDTLMIVTYDEHGGFYDHVDPRQFLVADDRPALRRYGVRVPALVVSPYVERGVSNVVFDHTSIINTILLRFCRRSDSAVQSMGARTAAANHLGSLLVRPADRPRGPASNQQLAALVKKVAAWRRATYRETTLGEATSSKAAAAPPTLTDLQEEIVAMSKRLRAAGLQPGEP